MLEAVAIRLSAIASIHYSIVRPSLWPLWFTSGWAMPSATALVAWRGGGGGGGGGWEMWEVWERWTWHVFIWVSFSGTLCAWGVSQVRGAPFAGWAHSLLFGAEFGALRAQLPTQMLKAYNMFGWTEPCLTWLLSEGDGCLSRRDKGSEVEKKDSLLEKYVQFTDRRIAAHWAIRKALRKSEAGLKA